MGTTSNLCRAALLTSALVAAVPACPPALAQSPQLPRTTLPKTTDNQAISPTFDLEPARHKTESEVEDDVTEGTGFEVDGDFAGGNIVVDSVAGDDVFLHQNLRDFGPGIWFYWNFRVKGAGGRKLTFTFTHPWGKDRRAFNVVGVRGPALSLDGGLSWEWMGADAAKGTSFTYHFPAGQQDVRFSNGMPYVSAQFVSFLRKYQGHPNLEVNSLALTREGRRVERVHLGNLNGDPKSRVILTARHHASEMMSSYVLEGIMQYLLEDPGNGKWFRENSEALILPFMDVDGVENGDQGKGRRGRDHNRDYSGTSIYASTAALRAYAPVWAADKPLVGIDLHCPGIRGPEHEIIHQVGNRHANIWEQQIQFAKKLQFSTADSQLVYSPANDIPFGEKWNTASSQAVGDSFQNWLPSIAGTKLATVLEVPFANASGEVVTQDNARALGADIANALVEYLKGLE